MIQGSDRSIADHRLRNTADSGLGGHSQSLLVAGVGVGVCVGDDGIQGKGREGRGEEGKDDSSERE